MINKVANEIIANEQNNNSCKKNTGELKNKGK